MQTLALGCLVQIPPLALTSRVTLDKLPNFSSPTCKARTVTLPHKTNVKFLQQRLTHKGVR